jgi:predicted PurR-regulated permease PerM
MFGFIKMIQQFIAKLHSNKRVWFTTIFFTATIGVILATYLLISTTNRVSNKVFAQQTKEYELRLKSLENLLQKKLAQLSIAFLQNEKLLNAIEANDQEALLQISNQYSSSITEDEKNSLSIRFYVT